MGRIGTIVPQGALQHQLPLAKSSQSRRVQVHDRVTDAHAPGQTTVVSADVITLCYTACMYRWHNKELQQHLSCQLLYRSGLSMT